MSDAPAHKEFLFQLTSLLPAKPPNEAERAIKKAYSESVSRIVAIAVAAELRRRGLAGARPTEGGLDDKSGAERQMAGGIGAKKVDVTWATEESGLLMAFSIKTINFKDKKSQNFQKNMTNRRGDLLFESITLHRRFPYSVIVGLFFLNEDAKHDDTGNRRSTFENTNDRLLMFKGRIDPAGRDEQFEHLYIGLLGINAPGGEESSCDFYRVGDTSTPVTFDDILAESLKTLVTRNTDMYSMFDGVVVKGDKPPKPPKQAKPKTLKAKKAKSVLPEAEQKPDDQTT